MSFRKWVGPALAITLVGAFVGTSNGCSSSSNAGSPAGDAAADVQMVRHPEASTPTAEAGMDSATSLWDGTSGKQCTSDADCYGIGGPHQNRCTIDVLYQGGEIDPTPICVDPLGCDPCGGHNPCDGYLHQCDGPDQSAVTPGICIPNPPNLPPQPGASHGVCQPACNFQDGGGAPTGCVGKDVCNPFGFGSSQGTAFGVGICQGGCTADSDCLGEKCDVLSGSCVKTVPTRGTAPLGAACSGGTDTSCYCPWNNPGACTAFCRAPAAGMPDPCGAGFLCITFQPATLIDSTTDASLPGFTAQNQGMAGFCLPTCTPGDGGASGEAGAGDAAPGEGGAGSACPSGWN
jgi:hypothetical protein